MKPEILMYVPHFPHTLYEHHVHQKNKTVTEDVEVEKNIKNNKNIYIRLINLKQNDEKWEKFNFFLERCE